MLLALRALGQLLHTLQSPGELRDRLLVRAAFRRLYPGETEILDRLGGVVGAAVMARQLRQAVRCTRPAPSASSAAPARSCSRLRRSLNTEW